MGRGCSSPPISFGPAEQIETGEEPARVERARPWSPTDRPRFSKPACYQLQHGSLGYCCGPPEAIRTPEPGFVVLAAVHLPGGSVRSIDRSFASRAGFEPAFPP